MVFLKIILDVLWGRFYRARVKILIHWHALLLLSLLKPLRVEDALRVVALIAVLRAISLAVARPLVTVAAIALSTT